jgi:rRNA processing protein Gar1
LQKVGELLIVETNSCINLVDLDNWLFNNNRECMGFVIDIFGRVEHPFYAIKLLEEVEKTVQNWS